MIIDGEDGVTHINVYSKGKTKLGRRLSNFAEEPFSIDGNIFRSVEGYWYWLLTGKEELKKLSGFAAKQFGKKFCTEPVELSANFKLNIQRATDEKLKANLSLLNLLAESELPFCHYYEYGCKRIDAGYEWIIDHIEARRKQLKNR